MFARWPSGDVRLLTLDVTSRSVVADVQFVVLIAQVVVRVATANQECVGPHELHVMPSGQ